MIFEHGGPAREEWETLLRGETLERPLEEQVALRELIQRPGLLWSILVFSGYLKVLSQRQLEDGTILGTLAIPNQEVLAIYRKQFADWLEERLGGDAPRRAFLSALLAGDAERVEEHLAGWLARHASYHDAAQVPQPERFYQGLVLGLLVSLGEDYEVRSNPETGLGRCDVLISPRRAGRPGVVLELKVANARRKEKLAQALKAAQEQLVERDYAQLLRERGAAPVHALAVAWLGKEVLVAPAARKPSRAGSTKRAESEEEGAGQEAMT